MKNFSVSLLTLSFGILVNLNLVLSQNSIGRNDVTLFAKVACYQQNNGYIDVILNNTSVSDRYDINWNKIHASGERQQMEGWPKENLIYGGNAEDLSDIEPGYYTVQITKRAAQSSEGCGYIELSIVVEEADEIVLPSPTITASCPELGNIVFDHPFYGRDQEFNYLWNNGSTSLNNSVNASGTYTLSITDNNNCTSVFNYAVTFNRLEIEETVINSCESNSIELNINPLTQNISWFLNEVHRADLRGLLQINNAQVGTYKYQISSPVLDCRIENEINILPNSVVTMDQNSVNIDPSDCNGNRGKIILDVSKIEGGTPPYSFQWSNGSTYSHLSGLSGGSYTVTITDALSCFGVFSYVVPTLNSVITRNEVISTKSSHCSLNNGEILISSQNELVFEWAYPINKTESGFSSNQKNLSPGIYWVKIIFASGCYYWVDVEVKEDNLELFFTDPTRLDEQAEICGNDGKLSFTLPESWQQDPQINFLWNTGSTNHYIENLTSGIYNLNITYGSCMYNVTGHVRALKFNVINADCSNNNGTIVVENPQYLNCTYSWSNGSHSITQTSLEEGVYSITVSTATCSKVYSIPVGKDQRLNFIDNLDYTCSGTKYNITLDLLSNIQLQNLTYTWNTGSNSKDLFGIDPGEYSLSITDENGCHQEHTIRLKPLMPEISIVDATECDGETIDGYLLVNSMPNFTVSNQHYPELELWPDLNFSLGRNHLVPGFYTLVSSHNNCLEQFEFKITTNTPVIELKEKQSPSDPCSYDGYLEVYTSPNCRVEWAGFTKPGHSIYNLTEGIFTATAYYANCAVVKSFELCACGDCVSDDGNFGTIPFYSCGVAPLEFSHTITSAETKNSFDGGIQILMPQSNTLAFKWYCIVNEKEIFISSAKNLSNIKTGIYKLYIENGCESTTKTFIVPYNTGCELSNIEYTYQNEICVGGNLELKIINSTNVVYVAIGSEYVGRVAVGESIKIPVKSNSFALLLYNTPFGCPKEVMIQTSNYGALYINLPYEKIKPCKSVEINIVSDHPPFDITFYDSSNTIMNSIINSYSTNFTFPYNKKGEYRLVASDNCGMEKEILFNLPCKCIYPKIIQESPCYEPCDIFDDWFGGECSKLIIDPSSLPEDDYTVTFIDGENNSYSYIKNETIIGPKEFKATDIGTYQVVFTSETGCKKIEYYYFGSNENYYCYDSKSSNQNIYDTYIFEEIPGTAINAIVGTWSFSDTGCGAVVDPGLPLELQPNFAKHKLEFIPSDFLNPCGGGSIKLKYPCHYDEVIPASELFPSSITLPTFSTEECDEVQPCLFYDGQGATYKVEVCKTNCPDNFSLRVIEGLLEISVPSYIAITANLSILKNNYVVHSEGIDINPGINSYSIDVSWLEPGEYTVSLFKYSDCPEIIKPFYICPESFLINPSATSDITSLTFANNITHEATIYLENKDNNSISFSGSVYVVNGVCDIDLTKLNLATGSYRVSITFKDYNCKITNESGVIFFAVLHNPDDCEKNIISISSGETEFIKYIHDVENSRVHGVYLSQSFDSVGITPGFNVTYHPEAVFSTSNDITLVVENNEPNFNLNVFSDWGGLLFNSTFEQSDFINFSADSFTGHLNVFYYDKLNEKIKKRILSLAGQITSDEIFDSNSDVNDLPSTQIFINNEVSHLVVNNDNHALSFSQHNQVITTNFNSQLNINNVFFKSDSLYVVGTIEKGFTINGLEYIEDYKSPVVLVLNENLELIGRKISNFGLNTVVKSTGIKDNKIIALLTEYYEYPISGIPPFDSCSYITEISPNPCPTFNSVIQVELDTSLCTLLWDTSGINDIQILTGGDFLTVDSNIVFPYDVSSYGGSILRVVKHFENCPSLFSDTLNIYCDTMSCPIQFELLYTVPDTFMYLEFLLSDTTELVVTLDFSYYPGDTTRFSTLFYFTGFPGINTFPINIDSVYPWGLGYLANWTFTLSCSQCPSYCEPISNNWYWGPVLMDVTLENRSSKVFLTEIYPNPTISTFTIDITSPKEELMSLNVVDILGKSVFSDELPIAKGSNRYVLTDGEHWPPGIYYIQISGSENKQVVVATKSK
ncbi:MAG: T9SS type A sorting domain-containing protein [Saprospiraceae bacterium]|nr:T9SS type A sorting domain-containing protein [Saprospiraceae bacterium]